MASPTTRSKKAMTDDGWYTETVEYWNGFTNRRHDLFGFTDILAMKEGETPRLIQTTTGTNFAARRTKIMGSERAVLALVSGFRIFLHGWRKLLVKRGGKAKRWVLLEEEITMADFHQQSRSRPREAVSA